MKLVPENLFLRAFAEKDFPILLFFCPFEIYMYLLSTKSIFLKDLKGFPLKCDVSSVSQSPWEDKTHLHIYHLTDTVGSIGIYDDHFFLSFHFPNSIEPLIPLLPFPLKCPVTSVQ